MFPIRDFEARFREILERMDELRDGAGAAADDMDEEELVAVLTAAVAACMNTSTYNLKIKSFRRIENTSPSWNKAGLRDVIDSRF